MLTPEGCLSRQRRLLAAMEHNRWDMFLTGNYRTAYYLTGSLASAETPVAFAMTADGNSILITPSTESAAVDERITLEIYSIRRSIGRPWDEVATLLRGWTREGLSRVGVESSATPCALRTSLPAEATVEDSTDVVLRLRRRKDPDEIDEIRYSLRLCAAAYHAAKPMLEPGRSEIDIHNAMYSAVAQEAGTSVTLAGDFACGTRAIRGGGAPTRRSIRKGDLFILDLFPAPALYFGDTSRTFCVGSPTDVQVAAWNTVKQALGLAEGLVRPKVFARDVYHAVKDMLDGSEIARGSFWHHAGHGIGHHGHETPRLIPDSDDVFENSDIVAIEPGLYGETLQGGIRLENNYIVREDGLENLFEFPLELA